MLTERMPPQFVSNYLLKAKRLPVGFGLLVQYDFL